MATKRQRTGSNKSVENYRHESATRKNIPAAEYESLLREEEKTPIQVAYEIRNPDLDPQLVWRGKDLLTWTDLIVQAPHLYIQEKVHPKVLIDDLKRKTDDLNRTEERQTDMFADFNGVPDEAAHTEFYQHDANWSNRMILGDSLQVMASLAEREGLRGKVQCIYVDPPYGIKFNSNFQWSTTSRNVTDGKSEHITREPEQVKAFRDTWRDGVHSYLTYLRDRFVIAQELLAESGSIFVQIGDENIHRVRTLLDEVFGDRNFVSEICVQKTGSQASRTIGNVADYVLWYAKDISSLKTRHIFLPKAGDEGDFSPDPLTSDGATPAGTVPFEFQGQQFHPGSKSHWKTTLDGLNRLTRADRIIKQRKQIRLRKYWQDNPVKSLTNMWTDTGGASNVTYVVQTSTKVIERCLLMATDPGDLVLDPTCGSGTTAFVAEQWGRRWITVDTSRVALALARSRVMGAKYPYYLLKDSSPGQVKEAERSGTPSSDKATYGDIRQGFVYERVPHVTLRSIARNSEIDVIWEEFQARMEPLREALNAILDESWGDWEVPRGAEGSWPKDAKEMHAKWWEQQVARQTAIDSSISSKADFEHLYDRPYEDRSKTRVAGPFTVESLSPHRVLGVDENDDLIDGVSDVASKYGEQRDFPSMVLDNLERSRVQQAHKEDHIQLIDIQRWPGKYVCAKGHYFEGGEDEGDQKEAAIFIGPEFGTVSRPDLVEAAKEAADLGSDSLIACAFNYDARSTDFDKLGRVPVLKARMSADLHMSDELKNTGKGNLFVIFGEPDVDLIDAGDDQLQVKVNGVDVFDPNSGKVRSDGADGIALWFVDTDYNEQSFFVRHAYFLGANDPYKSLKTTLKAQINEEAWDSLYSDTSRPFPKPESGRIAVKVINHLGDEVMKIFRV